MKASRLPALCFAVLACFGRAAPSDAGFTKEELEAGESDRRETTERRVHSLATELAATAKRYGNDSVSLQAGLLLHALQAGAVGACEVTVVGTSPHAGPSFLEVDIVTGLIFDEPSTRPKQIAHLWQAIAAPTLKGMKSFDIVPAGLELVFEYGVQRFAELAENKADPRAPFEPHVIRVAIPDAALADLVAGSIDAEALLDRSTVHDGVVAVPPSDLHAR